VATLFEGTDPLRLIAAMADGKLFMDHSPYVIDVGTVVETKRRFPTRVRMADLDSLYDAAIADTHPSLPTRQIRA
jgi:hypothetical protein